MSEIAPVHRHPEHPRRPERPNDPDLDVVRLAKRQSTRRVAMGILYERYRERVYNVALRILGRSEDAADVLQDVFVLLFRKVHRFEAKSVFASWVYRIAVNVSLDHLRRRRRAPAPTGNSAVLESPPPRDDLTLPERGASQHFLRGHVQHALTQLSDRLRVVIVLRYLEGLAYSEIADVLGCSVGTVKSRLNRAHAALRRALAPRYGPDTSGARTA